MIISDLQYIESVTEEVKGAGRRRYYYYRPRKASANGSASASAYGRNTHASSYTNVIADADYGFSRADTGASAHASSY